MWDPGSPTKDWTHVPLHWKADSQQLDHQGSPRTWFLSVRGSPITMASHWKETITKNKRNSSYGVLLAELLPWKTLNPQYLRMWLMGNMAPNPVWLESLQQGEISTQIHPQRHPVEMKAEVGVMLPEVKNGQRLPAKHQKLGDAWNRLSLPALRRSQPHWHFDLGPLFSTESIKVYFLGHSDGGNLSQQPFGNYQVEDRFLQGAVEWRQHQEKCFLQLTVLWRGSEEKVQKLFSFVRTFKSLEEPGQLWSAHTLHILWGTVYCALLKEEILNGLEVNFLFFFLFPSLKSLNSSQPSTNILGEVTG